MFREISILRCRMNSIYRRIAFAICLTGTLWMADLQIGGAQSGSNPGAVPETGYAAKKPVIGGACPTCPWGTMSELVRTVMLPHGWDIQICYNCAGGPREARMVAGAMMATPPARPAPRRGRGRFPRRIGPDGPFPAG